LFLQCQLDLEHCHIKALLDGDLTTPNGIYECTAAAEALQKCMAADIHPGELLYQMATLNLL
jgi:hypothetical protein